MLGELLTDYVKDCNIFTLCGRQRMNEQINLFTSIVNPFSQLMRLRKFLKVVLMSGIHIHGLNKQNNKFSKKR